MHTVVVAGQKGGGGKTTLVAHLAVAAVRAGDGPAVVIDADPQQTLATWWRARESDAPQLAVCSAVRKMRATLDTLAAAGFAYCFIDTPPAHDGSEPTGTPARGPGADSDAAKP